MLGQVEVSIQALVEASMPGVTEAYMQDLAVLIGAISHQGLYFFKS